MESHTPIAGPRIANGVSFPQAQGHARFAGPGIQVGQAAGQPS
jgi:hypothetical protein